MIRPLVVAGAVLIWLGWLGDAGQVAKGADWPPRDGLKVVFLGDSITQNGLYVRYVDAYLTTRFPDRWIEVIGLGLSSETLSGTTEPGHPFPRPDIRSRLVRALELTKPDLVFICYGMNDGIYHPPAPERTDLYRQGVDEVVAAIKQAGAEVIVGTPPPFDSRPVRARTLPISAPKFGYQHPYIDYDGVLGIYSSLLLAQRDDGKLVVADIHGATGDALAALRVTDPGFTFAPDGVHPGSDGHWLIARPYLEVWGATKTAEVDAAAIDARNQLVIQGAVELVASPPEDTSFRFTWTSKIPFPHDPGWDARLVTFERIDDRFNRHRLLVVGLPAPRYAIYEGDQPIAEVTRAQLAEGLDLLTLPKLSTNRRSAAVWPLIEQKHAILRPAWLEAVGHGPPLFGKALPLDQAKNQAEPIEDQIRALTRPVPLSFRLVPIKG